MTSNLLLKVTTSLNSNTRTSARLKDKLTIAHS